MADLNGIETTEPTVAPVVETIPVIDIAPKVEPFKSFTTKAELDSYLDREKQQAVKANEANAEAKAKKALEAATMTETQKIQAMADEMKAERELIKKERAEVAAKAVLMKLGIADEDIDSDMLVGIVDSDIEGTRARAERLGMKITSLATSIATKKMQDTMKSVTVPASAADNSTASTPEQLYKIKLAEAQKNPNDRKLQQEVFTLREKMGK